MLQKSNNQREKSKLLDEGVMDAKPDYVIHSNDLLPLNNFIVMPDGSLQYYWYIKRSENSFEDVAVAYAMAGLLKRLIKTLSGMGKIIKEDKHNSDGSHYHFMMVKGKAGARMFAWQTKITNTEIVVKLETNLPWLEVTAADLFTS